MRVSQKKKAKETMVELVGDKLFSILSGSPREKEDSKQPLSVERLMALSRKLVDSLVLDKRFLDCLLPLVPHDKDAWLTTEDAAKMSGFSRPFIAALFDRDLAGKVLKSEKGHRKIRRVDFDEWMELHQVSATSHDIKRVRRESEIPVDDGGSCETEGELLVRKEERERSLSVAQRLGAI